MMSSSTDETRTVADPRWARVLARDRSADGLFWYSVVTTGVYCRPSCPSRAAKPAHVRLHDTLAAAQETGCRACRRCRPDGPSADAENAAIVSRACRLIEGSDTAPSLAVLAASAGLSSGHFHRVFKAATGVTPRAYAAGRRGARVRAALASEGRVTDAIYAAGFGSSGRFYEASTALLGMTPTRFKRGGASEEIRFAVGASSLGAVLVASSARGVAAILIGDDPAALVQDLQNRFRQARLIGDDAGYAALVARVVGLVEAPGRGLDLPLDIRGTAFQQRVWQALRLIPAGQTASYTAIAARIGAPEAVRAVAGACAANNHAVAVPCHRVVRVDGGLSGYAWGVERKRALIGREVEAASGEKEGQGAALDPPRGSGPLDSVG